MHRTGPGGLSLETGWVLSPRRSRLMRGSAIFEVRPASWRQLLSVEVPLLSLLAFMFAVTFLFSPSLESRALGFQLPSVIVCPFFYVTGIPCLFCGITRSFLAMGGLDLSGAFVYHPLGPVIYLLLLCLALVLAVSIVRRQQVRMRISPALGRQLVRYGAILLLAAWLVKVAVWSDVGLL